jgi:lipopolysaccharide export system permease protein
VYEVGDRGIKRSVRAQEGMLTPDTTNKVVLIDLYDVRIDQPHPDAPMDLSQSHYINAEHYPVELDYSKMIKQERKFKKSSDMTINELAYAIRNAYDYFSIVPGKDIPRQRTTLLVEANSRLVLALSCFAFTLFGIPLGMRSHRRESSVGVAISLLVVFVFYFFIVIAKSMTKYPHLHPEFIVWIPLVAGELAGFLMIRNSN